MAWARLAKDKENMQNGSFFALKVMELLRMHQIKQIPLVLQNKSKLQQFKLIPIGGQNKFRRLKSKCLQLQNKQTRLASQNKKK